MFLRAAAPKGEFTGASRPVQLGLWALVSLNVGAWFSQGDEGAQILIHLEEFTGALLDRETTRTRLTERLERVARGSQLNDSLKLKLLREPGLPERLLELLATDADNVSAAARMHAAKTLENISSLREAKLEMVERGLHAPIVAVVADDGATLHARKTLAAAVCNLAAAPENVAALGAAGAVAALDGEQRFSAKLSRQKVRVALQRLGAALDADHAAVVNAMPPAERELVARLAAEAAEAADDPLNAARATLIESGVLLYLHTAAGGAAWGLFESVRNGEPRPVLMQNVARTSLVTCFVPILLVGGVVTAYERAPNDRLDQREVCAVRRRVPRALPGGAAPPVGRDVCAAVARRPHRRLLLLLRLDALHRVRPAQERPRAAEQGGAARAARQALEF